MHRPFLTWIVSFVVGLFLWSQDAASQSRNARLADAAVAARESGNAFVAMAGDTATNGKPPRQTDDAVRIALDRIFDTAVIAEERPFGYEDVPSLADGLQAISQALPVYLFAGTGISDLSHATPDQVEHAEAQAQANTLEFAPEIGRSYDAGLTLDAVVMDTVTAVQAFNPRAFGAAGLEKFKAGALQMVSSIVFSLQIEGLSEPWRLDRTAALIKVAPSFAKFMSPADIRSLRDQALETALRLSEAAVQGGLHEFAEALAH